jgi:hypothetical protein
MGNSNTFCVTDPFMDTICAQIFDGRLLPCNQAAAAIPAGEMVLQMGSEPFEFGKEFVPGKTGSC